MSSPATAGRRCGTGFPSRPKSPSLKVEGDSMRVRDSYWQPRHKRVARRRFSLRGSGLALVSQVMRKLTYCPLSDADGGSTIGPSSTVGHVGQGTRARAGEPGQGSSSRRPAARHQSLGDAGGGEGGPLGAWRREQPVASPSPESPHIDWAFGFKGVGYDLLIF